MIGGWGALRNSEGTRKGMLEEPEMAVWLQQDKVIRKGGGHQITQRMESGLDSRNERSFSVLSRKGNDLL